tara:strand:- start:905 stop:1189 length:285 start_codon:yes stop_codon:yes gene_type:complete
MAALSGLFLGWNIIVILILVLLFGVNKLAEKFTLGKYVIVLVFGIPLVTIAFLLSPVPYMLIKSLREDVRREHGSFWGGQKHQMRKAITSLVNL